MKVCWLIDEDMFGAYRDDLVGCIRDQGHEVKLIRPPSPPYRWDDVGCSYRAMFSDHSCVIALGDIELVSRIHSERRWVTGVFATIEHYKCSSYFCHYGEYLLNRPYIMLPFGELRSSKEFLFKTLGNDGRIFVRPDSPLKLFTGQVATSTSFEADLEFMGFYEFPQESLVVVSAPREIKTEWRFVVANRRIVTGCQYKHDGKIDCRAGYDRAAMHLATTIASSKYQPDAVWVMDICRTTSGDYHLLEIGGFSFADLYSCHKGAIVTAVSEGAAREWSLANA